MSTPVRNPSPPDHQVPVDNSQWRLPDLEYPPDHVVPVFNADAKLRDMYTLPDVNPLPPRMLPGLPGLPVP